MPLYINIPDETAPYLKLRLLGNIFSAIVYGIVIVLAGYCFQLLQETRGIYSNRMRIFLLIYVVVMLLLSTSALIQSICQFMELITSRTILPSYLSYLSVSIPPAIWGADGFMIWRCVMLYQGVPKGLRIVIFVLLILISLASFGFGVIVLVESEVVVREIVYAYTMFISLTALVNVILAALVVFRVVHHRRRTQNSLGVQHRSPYTTVITICIESSALMVISNGLYAAVEFGLPAKLGSPNWGCFLSTLLPHICVISPLLIVYRVSIGRAMPPTLLRSEQVMAPIQFNIPFSTLQEDSLPTDDAPK